MKEQVLIQTQIVPPEEGRKYTRIFHRTTENRMIAIEIIDNINPGWKVSEKPLGYDEIIHIVSLFVEAIGQRADAYYYPCEYFRGWEDGIRPGSLFDYPGFNGMVGVGWRALGERTESFLKSLDETFTFKDVEEE